MTSAPASLGDAHVALARPYAGRVRSADTSPEAHDLQIQIYRSMSPARRVSIAVAMSEEMLAVTAAGIGARHPDYDEEHVSWALRRLRLGDETFRAAWPNAPLVAP
jgi:hypothetical protein